MKRQLRIAGGVLAIAGMAAALGAWTPDADATATSLDPWEAAEAWLLLLDAGEYRESWEAAGQSFKDALTADAWAQQATAVRAQIGEIVKREAGPMQEMTDPPGAPPGQYVQLLYRSEFSVAGAANEVVIVVNEPERGWRVVGYFVQPPAE